MNSAMGNIPGMESYLINIKPWIIFFQDILQLFLFSGTFFVSINMAYRKPNISLHLNVAPAIRIYFIFMSALSGISILNSIYLIALFRPYNVIYDARIVYLTGAIPWIMIDFTTLAEFFLGLDRCLSVAFPPKYTKIHKIAIGCFEAILLPILVTVAILIFRIFDFFPVSPETRCLYTVCLINYTVATKTVYLKIIFGSLSLVAALILIILLKRSKISHTVIAKKSNHTVLFVICSTVIFEIIPSFITAFAAPYLGFHPATLLEQYPLTFSSINVALCSSLYWRVFRKTFSHQLNSFTRVTVVGNRKLTLTTTHSGIHGFN